MWTFLSAINSTFDSLPFQMYCGWCRFEMKKKKKILKNVQKFLVKDGIGEERSLIFSDNSTFRSCEYEHECALDRIVRKRNGGKKTNGMQIFCFTIDDEGGGGDEWGKSCINVLDKLESALKLFHSFYAPLKMKRTREISNWLQNAQATLTHLVFHLLALSPAVIRNQ